MSKISRYLDSLLELPTWFGIPIFFVSTFVPLFLVIFSVYLLAVFVSPWFLLAPVVIWAACAINWLIKNKDR